MGRRNPRYHPNCAIFAPLYPLTRETPRLFAAGRCSSLPQERMAGTAAAWLSHSAEFSATASLKSTNRFFVPIVFAILQFGFIISGFLLFVKFQTCKTPAKKQKNTNFSERPAAADTRFLRARRILARPISGAAIVFAIAKRSKNHKAGSKRRLRLNQHKTPLPKGEEAF